MPLSPSEWHARYTRQAGWTRDLRRYLFERNAAASADLILDVGSGTGALESDLAQDAPGFHGTIIGLDIDAEYIAYAKFASGFGDWVQGDALHLPFPNARFDLTFCHFLLLWVGDPLHALSEMKRVTRPNGSILALAEPDYGGRIDFPPELEMLGSWQQASLRSQRANPLIGRRLGWLFHQAGLVEVETGVLGAQWRRSPNSQEIESEWAVLHSDLEQILGSGEDTRWQADFEKLRRLDEMAWQRRERVLYVPTFYAFGKTPAE